MLLRSFFQEKLIFTFIFKNNFSWKIYQVAVALSQKILISYGIASAMNKCILKFTLCVHDLRSEWNNCAPCL